MTSVQNMLGATVKILKNSFTYIGLNYSVKIYFLIGRDGLVAFKDSVRRVWVSFPEVSGPDTAEELLRGRQTPTLILFLGPFLKTLFN